MNLNFTFSELALAVQGDELSPGGCARFCLLCFLAREIPPDVVFLVFDPAFLEIPFFSWRASRSSRPRT
jgi:hypothetical protein